MKRLPVPRFDPLGIFDACLAEIPHEQDVRNYQQNRPHIESTVVAFRRETATKTWCNLPRARHGHPEEIVAGTLSKGDMMNLYSKNLVDSKAAARLMYDEILVSARGKCPYCGEIGSARTLDHYLPKAKFPVYSVLPANLIPACRDCNTDAGAGFPLDVGSQPIHPYLDEEKFFADVWIVADVRQTDPIVVRFSAVPPEGWDRTSKLRAAAHFLACKLRDRFSHQVPGELGPLINQRRTTLRSFSEHNFREHLLVVADDRGLLLNGWKRVLYRALAASNWFSGADFNGTWVR